MTSEMTDQNPFAKIGIIGGILGAAGTVAAAYATNHHLEVLKHGATDASCNVNAQFSCDAIALSPYSELFNIPLGVWGLGYFLAMIGLCAAMLMAKDAAGRYLQAYKIFVGIGAVVTLALIGISVGMVKVGCPTCIAVYAICAAQLLSLALFRKSLPRIQLTQVHKPLLTASIVALIIPTLSKAVLPIPDETGKHAAQDTAEDSHAGHNHGSSTGGGLAPQVHEIKIAKSAYSGLGEDYRKGSDGAKVVITKFSDFQCPACMRMAEFLRRLVSEFGSRILVVYRNYPLDMKCNPSITRVLHEAACDAAILARCAGKHSKFWQYHDLAFAEQASASPKTAVEWAKSIGLSEAQIQQCQQDKFIVEKIQADIDLGNQLGVNATPTIFINGRKFVGQGFEALRFEVLSQLENDHTNL